MLAINKFHKLRYLEIFCEFSALHVKLYLWWLQWNNYCVLFWVSALRWSSPPKTTRANTVSECHSFYLAVEGQTSSYSCITWDTAVINYFQNHTALLFLLSTGSIQSTENTISLLKIEILKFSSMICKRRGDTNRPWPHGSQDTWWGPDEKGLPLFCIIKFTNEED